MAEYRLNQVQRRDEWESQYGPMVTYAIAVDGVEGWLKLNQKLATPSPQVGDTLNGNIVDAKDGKGQSYKKFQKVNPAYEGQSSSGTPTPSVDPKQLEYIVQMLEELTGRREIGEISMKYPAVKEDPFAGLDL